MANIGLLIGILVVIVIIAIAAVVLTPKGGSGGNSPQLITGSTGTLSYQTTSAAGVDSQSLTTPEGSGYFFCLQATWNATAYEGGVGGPEPLSYAIQPLCPWISSRHAGQESAVGVMTVYGASKYTYVFGNFTSTSTNYIVNSSASELTVIPVACAKAGCNAITLPSGCSVVMHNADINASVEVAVCANQSPGKYSVGAPPNSTAGPNVYMFYS